MSNKNRAVLYLRLSKEDKEKLNKGDSSASIKNQRLLLADYALEHDYEIVDVYSDDDESGLFDTRPDFERMINDAKSGKFDIAIAKTQARFTRNMEHVEKYLHHDFQNLGIRFIGVVDGADTANEGNKKSRQINGLVNEWYCEDLSRNIRSAFKAKMKDGQFLGASCPYGYLKDPKNHNHLVVDEYAAGVVRKIYNLYLQGYGKGKIARIITEEGFLIPTHYKREVLGINYYNSKEIETTISWSYQTIHMILNNEVYTGCVVQNRYTILSYKDKRRIKQPKDKWIRVENQHEPIIDMETFKTVQERQKIRTKPVNGDKIITLFSGILICADCKHAMARTYARRGNHEFTGYCCKNYKELGKKACPSHSIKYKALESAVLSSIKEEAGKILTPDDVESLNKMKYISRKKTDYQSQIAYLEKKIKSKEIYKKRTYKNFMDEVISKSEYLVYVTEFESETEELQGKLTLLKEKASEQEQWDSEYDEWIERFSNYIDIDELTRDVLLELIEKIEVNKDGSICIYYKFSNPYAGAAYSALLC